MIHEVHGLWPNLLEIELLLHRHRRGLDPVSIFPVARDRGHLADIDLRIEIGRKMLAMIAAVAVENVERVDAFEMMFLQPGRDDAGHAGIGRASCREGVCKYVLILGVGASLKKKNNKTT